jgi:hypothetical protein
MRTDRLVVAQLMANFSSTASYITSWLKSGPPNLIAASMLCDAFGVLGEINGLAQGQAGRDAANTRNGAEAFNVQNRSRKQCKRCPGYNHGRPRECAQGKARTCAQKKKNQEGPAHLPFAVRASDGDRKL